MARTDEAALVVSLEARIRDFEKNMAKAERTARKNFGAIEKRAKESGSLLEKTMAAATGKANLALKGLGAGFLGAATVAGVKKIASEINEVARGVAEIGNQAKRAGLTTGAFQELSFVAKQSRIGVDELVDGIKELQLRADEFVVTGKGSAAEAFGRLGYDAASLKTKLKDPAALFEEIIGKLGRLNRAARIRVADEVFGGTAGERFVELADRGSEGIARMRQEARDLGLVLSDDVIQRADEINRKFELISQTVSTHLKGAIVGAVGAMADWLDKFREFEEQSTRSLGTRLAELGAARIENENKILALQDQKRNTSGVLAQAEIRQLDATIAFYEQKNREIAEAEKRILDLLGKRSEEAGSAAKEATPAVSSLNTALQNTAGSTTNGAAGLKTYADAVRALKNEIPGLAEQLAVLDARAKIEGAYTAAVTKARTMGEVYQANALRNQALAAVSNRNATEAASRGMLDLIGYAEGTDRGRGYNETLGYGAFTGGNQNLVLMSLDQIDALQGNMLADPNNTFNSSALGRYQITRTTLRGLREQLGLSGSELFDPTMQDRLAEELLRRRGNDPAGLRNEWEGLRRVDDSTIRAAYDNTSTTMPGVDQSVTAKTDALKQQQEAYSQIVSSAQQFQAEQRTEASAMSMTTQQAAAYRYEQQMLAEAQRQNIALTPQQRQEISQLAQGMAEAEARTKSLAKSQEQANQLSQAFGQTMVNSLAGLITGSQTAEQALRGVLNQLVQMALQAALLNQGPLAGLFGGTSTTGGLGIFGFIGSLFGFAEGGEVRGPGTATSDSIPAMLSDGEFVVRASEAAKHRRLLEMINSGRVSKFATGGAVGRATRLPQTVGDGKAPAVSIKNEVTVNGSAGTPEQNADLAKRMGRQLETTMRGVVADEIARQMRPGALLYRR